MGVMPTQAKWAFEKKATADEFMTQHGGRPAIFEEVMKAAFEDMYEDTLMILKVCFLEKYTFQRPTQTDESMYFRQIS